jgi:hypothetical protein
MLTIFGFLAATVLPFRFNVLILVPAFLVGWLLVLIVGLATMSSVSSIALNMLLVPFALQIGYLAGIVLKWALLASGLNRRLNWSDKPAVKRDSTFSKKRLISGRAAGLKF